MTTTSSSDNNTECPICCSTVQNPGVQLSCCQNRFCRNCLHGWRNDLTTYCKGHRTCPCCRALIAPTQDVLSEIAFYQEIATSIRTLMQTDDIRLPLPPFPCRQQVSSQDIVGMYESMEFVHDSRVSRFEQHYGPIDGIHKTIPSPRPKAIPLPPSVVQAVRSNSFEAVLEFLGTMPFAPVRLNATCRKENGNTLLHVAVQTNNLDIVNALLALGANPNVTNAAHFTPLYYAVKKMKGNDDRIAKSLIRWGAKKVSTILPKSSNSKSTDPLLIATADFLGHSELARMLQNEADGRHCKSGADDIWVRCTIIGSHVSGEYHLNPDACDKDEIYIASTAHVEICKPLLFDFRNVNHNALFPNQPTRFCNNRPTSPLGQHHPSQPGRRVDGVIMLRPDNSSTIIAQESLDPQVLEIMEFMLISYQNRHDDPETWNEINDLFELGLPV